jgi:hypothetical protein
VRLLHLSEVPLPLCGPAMLHSEEVSSPKTIKITQYLSENVDFYDAAKKNDLMAAINSLNRLNCYKEWRKYIRHLVWRLVLIV